MFRCTLWLVAHGKKGWYLMAEINWEDKWRLGLHLMPPSGWLNDPNGLCQFQGMYHVFFQYTPDDPNGGMKYWGHYMSPDLLNWEYAGIALSPEETFESGGVYSGSALIEDGKMNLFYTGNVKLKGDYNYITDGRQGNTVLVSSKDGRTFGKKECLMTNADYPSDLTCHVRDPKVVTGKSIGKDDENFYMFLGARTKNNVGEVLVYKSASLRDWEHTNTLKSEAPFGYMWECPDAFTAGQRKFLSVSPQGVEQSGNNYQNIYQSGYYELTGEFDQSYELKNFREWDRGFDFYAPQTFCDESGRRILIGWIGMPDDPSQSNPTVEQGWQNALTIPREITEKEGKLLQYPVKEIENLRREERTLKSAEVSEEMQMYDMEIGVLSEDIRLTVSDAIDLIYSREKEQFMVSFQEDKNMGYGRSTRAVNLKECRNIRILADTSCLEIYLNDGEEVFTTRFYPESGTSSVRLSDGNAVIKYWQMEKMKIADGY